MYNKQIDLHVKCVLWSLSVLMLWHTATRQYLTLTDEKCVLRKEGGGTKQQSPARCDRRWGSRGRRSVWWPKAGDPSRWRCRSQMTASYLTLFQLFSSLKRNSRVESSVPWQEGRTKCSHPALPAVECSSCCMQKKDQGTTLLLNFVAYFTVYSGPTMMAVIPLNFQNIVSLWLHRTKCIMPFWSEWKIKIQFEHMQFCFLNSSVVAFASCVFTENFSAERAFKLAGQRPLHWSELTSWLCFVLFE